MFSFKCLINTVKLDYSRVQRDPSQYQYNEVCYTVKSVHVVTSIKQLPVFKGHLIFFYIINNCTGIEPLLRGHLSYMTTFS